MQQQLESSFGPGQQPRAEEVQAAVREILEAESRCQQPQPQGGKENGAAPAGELCGPATPGGGAPEAGVGGSQPRRPGPTVLSELRAQAAELDELD